MVLSLSHSNFCSNVILTATPFNANPYSMPKYAIKGDTVCMLQETHVYLFITEIQCEAESELLHHLQNTMYKSEFHHSMVGDFWQKVHYCSSSSRWCHSNQL